jgi:hypothetical protein
MRRDGGLNPRGRESRLIAYHHKGIARWTHCQRVWGNGVLSATSRPCA